MAVIRIKNSLERFCCSRLFLIYRFRNSLFLVSYYLTASKISILPFNILMMSAFAIKPLKNLTTITVFPVPKP